jgi:hypothetical protein
MRISSSREFLLLQMLKVKRSCRAVNVPTLAFLERLHVPAMAGASAAESQPSVITW